MCPIKVTGLEELEVTLKDNVTLDDVKGVVNLMGQKLVGTMVRQTTKSYVGGYSGNPKTTGNTAGSINKAPIIENGGLTAIVKAQTEYVEYVEKGTRFMPPEPIVQPSLDVIAPQFFNSLKRLNK